ncbi:lytic transglycosylase, partial [Enterobacter hormaechei]
MKAKAILLASVLLVGCQSQNGSNVQQHAQSLSAAGQGEAGKFTSQARWLGDGT